MKDPGRRAPVGTSFAARGSALDRPMARVLAFLVFLAAAATLAWIHRDDLWPRPAATAAGDPVAECLVTRAADIDQMRDDGVIDEARAALFKGRAEALCQAQFGEGAGPPALPK